MKILVDLDGVIVDFYGGVEKLYKVTLHPHPPHMLGKDRVIDLVPNLTEEQFYKDIKGDKFWIDLQPYPYAAGFMKKLEELFGFENIAFLSKPVLDPYCSAGKFQWVYDHFPEYKRKVLIGAPKEFCANSGSLLIDDTPKNCELFIQNKGKAILFPQPWNTYKKFDLDIVYAQLREYSDIDPLAQIVNELNR